MTDQKKLYLFPDTNVFLQCLPLEHVDWGRYASWESVEIVLTRPVQGEIDSFKGKGNRRQASRARTASTLFGSALAADDNAVAISSTVSIRLCLRQDLRPYKSADDILNYDERDDQLVGIALGFQKDNPGAVVKILSNDIGPKLSAKAVGLQFEGIPEEWVLPPESDEAERREKELKQELARYQRAEPELRIEVLQPEAQKITANVTLFSPLSDYEVQTLMAQLEAKHPLATDFGSSTRQKRSPLGDDALEHALGPLVDIQQYEPATKQSIERYKEAYGKWVDECKNVLVGLHAALNISLEWPTLLVRMTNVGSRPAQDALVEFMVQGGFHFVPVDADGTSRNDERRPESPSLPLVPKAPQGTWRKGGFAADFEALARHLKQPVELPYFDARQISLAHVHRRDVNGFYFKNGQRGVPSSDVTFSCEQWRHAREPEEFEMLVRCAFRPGVYSGLVKVVVHATNLTKPHSESLPIRVQVDEQSSFDFASALIDNVR